MLSSTGLRKEKLKLRDGLSHEQRQKMSEKINEKILHLDEVRKGHNIFVYVSFRSEVQTLSLIEKLLKNSKTVSVPITHVREKKIEAIKIEDVSHDLTSGYCGILEPRKELCTRNVVHPEIIDLVVVPGSVFDERGGRFGYGGGYYDRFLESIPDVVRVGLAFEVQIVKEIPLQKHDELLDFIITEERVIKAKR